MKPEQPNNSPFSKTKTCPYTLIPRPQTLNPFPNSQPSGSLKRGVPLWHPTAWPQCHADSLDSSGRFTVYLQEEIHGSVIIPASLLDELSDMGQFMRLQGWGLKPFEGFGVRYFWCLRFRVITLQQPQTLTSAWRSW